MAEQRDIYTTPRRLPALDGIRGIAVLLVLVSHADMTGDAPAIEWIARLGDFGVKIFFVLSGFLITTLLVDEHGRTGRIAIGRFVARRAFRIFPAAYVFMFSIIAAARSAGSLSNPATRSTHSPTQRTIPPRRAGGLATCGRCRSRSSTTWRGRSCLLWLALSGGAYVMIATLIVAPAIRAAIIITAIPGLEEGIERGFIMAVDGFAAGGLLAILRSRLEGHERLYAPASSAVGDVASATSAGARPVRSTTRWCSTSCCSRLIYLALAFCLHRFAGRQRQFRRPSLELAPARLAGDGQLLAVSLAAAVPRAGRARRASQPAGGGAALAPLCLGVVPRR